MMMLWSWIISKMATTMIIDLSSRSQIAKALMFTNCETRWWWAGFGDENTCSDDNYDDDCYDRGSWVKWSLIYHPGSQIAQPDDGAGFGDENTEKVVGCGQRLNLNNWRWSSLWSLAICTKTFEAHTIMTKLAKVDQLGSKTKGNNFTPRKFQSKKISA